MFGMAYFELQELVVKRLREVNSVTRVQSKTNLFEFHIVVIPT